ncbi:hypothetical protein BU25DRAFT_492343 [Macroventuria anomochaeta]|uniref:Uncharacterized protein n=1 Tax=Macroventuria anomochaeta TaxID=301207 RepID=A0ACB6RZ51_9PLEO|nr:uncharacterized protein BU25DRAFT_492343 [Macroventuria anomochaeta]KAF2626214.1 hypothetical protein BU25DRAFT_492343 [Macroventuria anomochaeta]
MSLKSQIHEVITIPHEVLEGITLSQSSVDERFRWRQNRHTKLKEDAVYSLSGIFDVDMAPVYSEGTEEAFRRLHDKIRSREECLRDLGSTDSRNDKKRIEDTKGGLLEGSYRWVLDNSSFQQWHNDPATAVLRGLLYLLVNQQPALIANIRKTYDQAGKTMFDDANACVALTEILADVLQDPSLGTTYLVIDALDECITDLPKLLHFLAKYSFASFQQAGHNLSLELNAKSVAAAVDIFIKQEVDQLAQEKQNKANVRSGVLQQLTSNANGTFLWVALVCQDLKATPKWNVLKKIALFPPRLDSLYRWMMQQISKHEQDMRDANELTRLVQDARRFVMYHKGPIESYPLQTYASALFFSPTGSMIRRLFRHEEPKGVTVKPVIIAGWSACLQTLEGHSSAVSSVAFSHDSTKLALASYDNTIKL